MAKDNCIKGMLFCIFLIILTWFVFGCSTMPSHGKHMKLGKQVHTPYAYTQWKIREAVKTVKVKK